MNNLLQKINKYNAPVKEPDMLSFEHNLTDSILASMVDLEVATESLKQISNEYEQVKANKTLGSIDSLMNSIRIANEQYQLGIDVYSIALEDINNIDSRYKLSTEAFKEFILKMCDVIVKIFNTVVNFITNLDRNLDLFFNTLSRKVDAIEKRLNKLTTEHKDYLFNADNRSIIAEYIAPAYERNSKSTFKALEEISKYIDNSGVQSMLGPKARLSFFAGISTYIDYFNTKTDSNDDINTGTVIQSIADLAKTSLSKVHYDNVPDFMEYEHQDGNEYFYVAKLNNKYALLKYSPNSKNIDVVKAGVNEKAINEIGNTMKVLNKDEIEAIIKILRTSTYSSKGVKQITKETTDKLTKYKSIFNSIKNSVSDEDNKKYDLNGIIRLIKTCTKLYSKTYIDNINYTIKMLVYTMTASLDVHEGNE